MNGGEQNFSEELDNWLKFLASLDDRWLDEPLKFDVYGYEFNATDQ